MAESGKDGARGGKGEGTSRERIVGAAARLLEDRGYHGTGMAELVKESGAPKGSVYFHFPGGKEQIAAEAVEASALAMAARIRENLAGGADGALAIARFLEAVAERVEESGFRSGGPLQIVAAETATMGGILNGACRNAYALMRDAFADRLVEDGFDRERAASLATTVLAASEGAIALSRTWHSAEPLRRVAEDLADLVALARSRCVP